MSGVVTVDGIELPACDLTDPAQLIAWWGNFGFGEHYRKVVLANCYELERARAAATKTHVTEARLKELARINPAYLGFLADGLQGRIIYERESRTAARA